MKLCTPPMVHTASNLMQQAIEKAKEGIKARNGGPFGSVITLNGEIIGQGSNRVLIDNDPTAHGEMVAIRDACSHLKTHDLSGAVLYTTCYPCPMCACACRWAGISTVVYGCTAQDAEDIGFSDKRFYEAMQNKNADLLVQADFDTVEACRALFKEYTASAPKLY